MKVNLKVLLNLLIIWNLQIMATNRKKLQVCFAVWLYKKVKHDWLQVILTFVFNTCLPLKWPGPMTRTFNHKPDVKLFCGPRNLSLSDCNPQCKNWKCPVYMILGGHVWLDNVLLHQLQFSAVNIAVFMFGVNDWHCGHNFLVLIVS